MNPSLRLIRDAVHVLMFLSGAAAVTYGWWFLLLFIPTFALCYWHNATIDNLIATAIEWALRNTSKEADVNTTKERSDG